MDERKDKLKRRLDEAHADLMAVVSGLTAEQAGRPTPNVAWTVKDVLAHLAGAERGHQQVIRALLASQLAEQPDFDLDTFNQADVAAREGWTLAKLLEDLNAGRAATLALLESLGADDWDRAGCHPGGFDTTVEGTFRVIAIHERRHAKDIRVALAGAERNFKVSGPLTYC